MSIIDTIGETLQKTVDLYGQIEAVKLQTQLVKAQASAAAANQPTMTQQAQAANQLTLPFQNTNQLLVIGALVVGAVALYAIVK